MKPSPNLFRFSYFGFPSYTLDSDPRSGHIAHTVRVKQNQHKPLLVVLTGQVTRKDYTTIGTALEKHLFDQGIRAYRYGFQVLRMTDTDTSSISELRQLGSPRTSISELTVG